MERATEKKREQKESKREQKENDSVRAKEGQGEQKAYLDLFEWQREKQKGEQVILICIKIME